MSVRGTLATACALFMALGVGGASIGPALPNLAANTGSNLAALGSLISALFLGSLITQLVAGPLNDRVGQRPLLMIGMVLIGIGMLGITASYSLPLMLACAIVTGLGQGFVVLCLNLLAAEQFSERSAAALNLINMFYGIGAVAGPAIASLTLQRLGTALPALWVGAAMTLALLPLVNRLPNPPRPSHTTAAPRARIVLRTPVLWLFGAFLLCYVGTEQGLGGWTTEYLVRTTTIGAASAALVTSGFWLALTAGRMLAALLGTRLASQTLLIGCLAGATVGALLLAASTGNATLTILAVLIIGLSFAPIYPTMMSIVTAAFPRTPGTAASGASALGCIGAIALPWLQGVLLERNGPPASVLLVAIVTVVMVALHVVYRLVSSTPRVPLADARVAAPVIIHELRDEDACA